MPVTYSEFVDAVAERVLAQFPECEPTTVDGMSVGWVYGKYAANLRFVPPNDVYLVRSYVAGKVFDSIDIAVSEEGVEQTANKIINWMQGRR